MTIKEIFNAYEDMRYEDIYILHCKFDNSLSINFTDNINGFILYQDVYDIMPEVLKNLEVKRLSNSGSLDGRNKWEIWVV